MEGLMAELAAAVGRNQPNHPGDVMTVQSLLNRNIVFLIPLKPLAVDGRFGPATEAMIRTYQTRVLGQQTADGVVHPTGATIRALSGHAAPPRRASTAKSGGIGGISEEEFVEAARALGCETAAVKAVVATELGVRNAFDELHRPTILFERHYFYKLTNGKFATSHPDICSSQAGAYGKFSEQYPKLERAMKLDKSAALRSASWGAFQIMGDNFRQAGFASVEDFVAAMKESVEKQVAAFISFVKNSATLSRAIRQKDWTTFARTYNGPGYAANQYDVKMKQNYEKFLSAK
jgi:hypothetical protein